jgi:hypothetical protein
VDRAGCADADSAFAASYSRPSVGLRPSAVMRPPDETDTEVKIIPLGSGACIASGVEFFDVAVYGDTRQAAEDRFAAAAQLYLEASAAVKCHPRLVHTSWIPVRAPRVEP